MSEQTLGAKTSVMFVPFNKEVEGKVDTGATTSCLHATNIQVSGDRVTFTCEPLSPNAVTLDLVGMEEVHHAGDNGEKRPTVKIDIEINGTPMKGATFNLNDRSNMDSPVLLGQNVLKDGGFTIKLDQEQGSPDVTDEPPQVHGMREDVFAAVELLVENNVTLADLVEYLRVVALNKIK